MLSSLKIENVAVIEYSEIMFDRGLNILTGETGAGKSIIIDAINTVLGERTSKDIIRSGADKAKVTAYFEELPSHTLKALEELGIDCEDDSSLLITRIINYDGRNICRVNGNSVTVSMLKAIGRELITICGQHDSQHLLVKEHHIDFIDAMADCEELSESYRETYNELKSVRKKLKKLLSAEDERENRIDFLKYQIDELTAAGIKPGERAALKKERDKISSREEILRSLAAVEALINGDGESRGLSEGVYALLENLQSLSRFDDRFTTFCENLEELRYVLSECSSLSSSSLISDDGEYGDINAIEERLDEIYRLSRKYGATEEEMLSYLAKIVEEYNSLVSGDEMIEELQDTYNELANELFKRGCYLSDCRKQTAIDFEDKVVRELHYLDMPDASFTVDFREANATENGMDEVEFLFSANAGQEMKPLIKIASGGELSRVMLAIRCVLSDCDSVETMIFDEIDTGVSGRAAHKIAKKMHELSACKQVLCVTHLAQIAAYADNHLYIEKKRDEDTTYTVVTSLDSDEKIKEIARIIGGDIITETTLDSAKELIAYAHNN
ncbi:MAG: DNA repair protein RecN [Ruminococcaceae bacterium]|nr:DNA repair protein RecN [Oscillospiraceae bacterium]